MKSSLEACFFCRNPQPFTGLWTATGAATADHWAKLLAAGQPPETDGEQ